MKRGKETRCFGFLSDDGRYAHCSREEYAGKIAQNPTSKTHAHLLYGDCNCGTEHNPKTASPKQSAKQFKKGIVAEYDYVDDFGELLYQVCRKEPKGFYQRRPHDDGSWIWALSEGEYAKHPNGDWKLVKADTPSDYLKDNFEEVRRVLYRLQELLNADLQETVFIVEGEKDADALNKLGLVATTNVSGSEKWRKEYNEYLKDRPVVILPDNDDAGRSHALQIANYIKGIAKSIKIIKLPNLPEKGDVSDWLDAGGTVEELKALCEKETVSEATNNNAVDIDVCMADVQPEEVEWLLYPYIPLGKLTIIEGDPDEGKSFLTLAIAAAISNGYGLPFGEIKETGNVLLLSAEDGRADTIRPRLDLLGADVSKIFAVAVPLTLDEAGFEQLERTIEKRQIKMVLFDPLFAYVGGKTDINQDNKVRAITTRLSEIAEENNCAIGALRHLSKAQQRNAKSAGSSSIAWTAAARSVLLVGHDPDDESSRGFVHTKHNLSAKGASQGYRIEAVNGKPKFRWTGESSLTAEKILNGFAINNGAVSKVEEAENFLKDILKNSHKLAEEVEKLAEKRHISEATLRRAKGNLGVMSHRPSAGIGKWYWYLPDAHSDEPDTQFPLLSNEHLHNNGLTLVPATVKADAQDSNGDNVQIKDISANEHLLEHPLTTVNNIVTVIKADAQKGVPVEDEQQEFDNDEWLERAAILEYQNNIPREEAEFLARISVDSEINLFKPEKPVSDSDYKKAA
jgi:5S rRNA maturation endonuclease (ribonuclease M5)